MTKTEALAALDLGKVIRHRSFMKHEFIRKLNGKILDESGLVLDEKLFWQNRNAGFFNEGWSSHELSEYIKP